MRSYALQLFSSWPTDLWKLQYKIFGVYTYFCICWQSCGMWPLVLQISHQGPSAYGKGLGTPLARYSTKTRQFSFECPLPLHLVHQVFSCASFPFLISCTWRVKLANRVYNCVIHVLVSAMGEASNFIAISRGDSCIVRLCCINGILI